jgi:O-antigen ligase
VLLFPLAIAALTKGDLRRVRAIAREQRLLFWSVVAISVGVTASYFSVPSEYGALKLVAYWGLNMPLFAFPLVLIRDERDARQLLLATMVVSMITLASSLVGSTSVWSQSALRGTKTAIGQLANEKVDVGIWFARRVALGGLAAIALLLMTRARKPWLYWLVAVACFGGAALAASRGPVIGIVLAVAFMIAIPGRAVLRKGVRMAILLTLLTGAVVGLAFLPGQFAQRYATTFSTSDASLQARLNVWDHTLELVNRSPLTGVGLGHYPIAVYGLDQVIYPHNILLEFAAELGIPMAVFLLLMALATLRSAYRGMRGAPGPWLRALSLWAIGLLVLSFEGAQLSGDLRTNEHLWFTAGIAAAVALLARRPRDDRVADEARRRLPMPLGP